MAANRSSRRLPNELFWETAKWARLEHYERNLLENGAARLLVGAAFGVYLRQHCHKLKVSASNNNKPTMRVKCRHCNASIDINDYLNHFNECGAPQAFFNANFTLDPTIEPPLDSTGEGTSNAALRERGAETESGTNATAPIETAPSSVSTIHNIDVIDDVMQDPFIAGVVSSNTAHFDGVNLALVPIVPPSIDSLDEPTSTAALSRKRGAETGSGAGVSGSPPNKTLSQFRLFNRAALLRLNRVVPLRPTQVTFNRAPLIRTLVPFRTVWKMKMRISKRASNNSKAKQ